MTVVELTLGLFAYRFLAFGYRRELFWMLPGLNATRYVSAQADTFPRQEQS